MAQLASCKRKQAEALARQAELVAEEARILADLADGETVDMRTGRLRPAFHVEIAEPPNTTDAERAYARQMLRNADRRNAGR